MSHPSGICSALFTNSPVKVIDKNGSVSVANSTTLHPPMSRYRSFSGEEQMKTEWNSEGPATHTSVSAIRKDENLVSSDRDSWGSTASSSGSSRRPHPLRPGHAVALRPGIAMAPRDRLHRAGTACRCPATSARLALLVLHGESESSAARADHRREEGGGVGGGQSDGMDHLPASWRPLRLEIKPGPAPPPSDSTSRLERWPDRLGR